jgi:hypothetical protein
MCGHIEDAFCNCAKCRENRYLLSEMMIGKKRALLRNSFPTLDFSLSDIKELSFENTVYLMALTRHSLSEDFRFVSLFDKNPVKLAPTRELTEKIINDLKKCGVINISPESNLEHFIYDDELTSITAYYPSKVQWEFLPSLSLKEKKELVIELERRADNFEPEKYILDAAELWKLIALHECLEYFYYLLESRGFSIEKIGDKTKTTFETLLEKFSVGQLLNLSWQSIRDTVDYLTTNKIPKFQVAPIFANNLQRRADRSQAERWTIKNSRRDYNCAQTVISSTFFNVFLGLGDAALNTIAPK